MIEWIIPLSIIGLIILGMQIKDYKYPSQIQKEFTKEFNKQWEEIKMTEKRFTMYQNTIYDNGNVLSPFNCMKVMNTLHNENEQLKQQMQRLYNYFADWFDDRVRPSDFSEMWDFVKEDEKWD